MRHGKRLGCTIRGELGLLDLLYLPQVAQELDVQDEQAGALPATTRPPLWALNNEIKRDV